LRHEAVTKVILVLVYPLLVLGRGLNFVFGRDPLRLREPAAQTCWIARGPEPSRMSYFSEASELEGDAHGGFGRLATGALRWIARSLAPPRGRTGEEFRATAERDRDIPDEIYTLW
jgi:hypothetical protein